MGLVHHSKLTAYPLTDTGVFPNSKLPALLYARALTLPAVFKAKYIKRIFARHGWTNAWDAGVFTYHHYHSTTHEVLGFYKGMTILQLGGPDGVKLSVQSGDVLVIPAGVAHCNLGSERQVSCIGAYPDGRDYDILRGEPGDRPAADRRIAALPVPSEDPVTGVAGELVQLWTGLA
ncbi:MAG TPA: cupin [Puia sp.]|nr:cupin [Puia sp.]